MQLKKITNSPYLNLLSGLVLIASAGFEIWQGFEEPSLGAHHGILFFGIVHVTKTIPEIMHGLKELEEAKEAKELE